MAAHARTLKALLHSLSLPPSLPPSAAVGAQQAIAELSPFLAKSAPDRADPALLHVSPHASASLRLSIHTCTHGHG